MDKSIYDIYGVAIILVVLFINRHLGVVILKE